MADHLRLPHHGHAVTTPPRRPSAPLVVRYIRSAIRDISRRPQPRRNVCEVCSGSGLVTSPFTGLSELCSCSAMTLEQMARQFGPNVVVMEDGLDIDEDAE